MQTAYDPGDVPPSRAVAPRRPRPPLVRPADGRVLGGVAAGLADHLGLSTALVRVVFVLLSVPFGAGLAAYAFLWATMRAAPRSGCRPAGSKTSPAPAVSDAAAPAPAVSDAVRRWLRSENQPLILALLGVAALTVAGALWLSGTAFDLHPEIVLPLVAIVVGTIFFWSQLDQTVDGETRRPVRWLWLVVGLGLTTLGLVGLVVRGSDIGQVWQVAGAVLAALVGVLVLAAPWVLRLWGNLREEQAARIRATERADIAAHLHDSVLQTLALIQRRSSDASTVARLARAQERQLRA